MASSSSNPLSTSSSSSTASTPSAALALSDSERVRPRLASRAAAPVLSEMDWPQLDTRAAAPPTNPACAHRRGGRRRKSAGVRLSRNSGVSQRVPLSLELGWESAVDDPTSTLAPVMCSTEEGSSSSASAWSEPFASSGTTPSHDITLAPNASGSGPAVVTSALTSASSSASGVKTIAGTAPEWNALISSTSSVLGVMTKAASALEPDVTTSTTLSARGFAKIVDAALEPEPDASAPVTTTIANPSAATSAAGAAPTTIPSLCNNWVAQHWGIVPRPVEHRPGGQQEAFGGNGGMPPVEALSRPDPLCPWREQVPPCWVCRLRAARLVARPCGHLAICVCCYGYANSYRLFVCPCCASPIT